MEATVVTYNYKLTKQQMISCHLMFYCWANDISLTPTEMKTCILLGLLGKQSMVDFCQHCVNNNVHESEDSCRNIIGNLCNPDKNKMMITKEGEPNKKQKMLSLSKEIGLRTDFNTILNIKGYYGDFKMEEDI